MTPSDPPATTPPQVTDEQLLLDFLRLREVHCPVCQYNLHRLTVPRCPECGRDLRLTVGTLDPFMRAWVILAAATFGSAGIGILCAACIAIQGWPGRWESVCECIMSGAMIFFMLMIPVAAIVVTSRRRFLKRSRTTQWIAAGLAIGASVLVFATMLLSLRFL